MHHFRNILVGVDLSHADRIVSSALNPSTREAILRAQWLASRLKAKLTFFAAIELQAASQAVVTREIAGGQQDVEEKAQGVLDSLVADAVKLGVEATSRLTYGAPATEIIPYVERERIDLVVVGTRSRGVVSRILMGSTAMALLRRCPSAVWVAKPDPNWDDLNILVATDLTDLGQSAIAATVGLSQLTHGKVHLLHAVETPSSFDVGSGAFPAVELDSLRNKAREEAEYAVNNQLSRTDFRTLKQGVQVHVEEKPADTAILEAIGEYGIDLLVIGATGRRGIAGLLMGNTAERLLPDVSCSLLAIKPEVIAPAAAS